jgi:nucleoside-diphosphate-sugar epimerase
MRRESRQPCSAARPATCAWQADVSRAAERLGFHARTPLEAGLRETVRWYAGAPH